MATSLTEIIKDPNYINANPETQRAIFEKYAPLDPNYSNANAVTQEAIRSKFGITQPKFTPREATPADIPGAIEQPKPTSDKRGVLDYIVGVPEAALTLASGAVGLPLSAAAALTAYGVNKGLGFPVPSSPKPVQEYFAKNLIYQPQTKTAQDILGGLGDVATALKIPSYSPAGGAVVRPMPNALRQNLRYAAESAEPVTNALAATRQGVATGAQNVMTGAASLASGKPQEALKQAYQAGKEGNKTFVENLRGNVPPTEMLTAVKEGLSKIQDDNAAAYRTAKTGWAADKTPLDFTPIDTAFENLKASLQERGKSKIGAGEQKVVDEIGKVLDEWRSDPDARTTLDLDALKQRLDAVYPDSPAYRQARRAVTDISKAVKDTIIKQAPDYAEAMKSYGEQLDLMRDINRALGTGDKVATETAINKVMSLVKNKPSSDYKRQLVQQLKEQGGADIMPMVAGQELSSYAPTGFGRLSAIGAGGAAYLASHPGLALALPLTSPRLMGEAFYGAGRVTGAKNRALGAANRMIFGEQPPTNMLRNNQPD